MVEYLLCPGELVEGVELRKYSGVTDYEVIWAIRAEPPSTRQTFVIGFVPRGFVDSVTLKEDLVASVDYGVFVDSTDQSIAINTFTLDELSETSVLTSWKNESVSRAEFAAGRDANC